MSDTSIGAVEVDERSVIAAGHRLSWLEAGPEEAHPLVLIHGLAEGSHTWQTALPRLARNHRIIAVDLIGHGRSAKPELADYSIPGMAAHVRDLLRLLEIENATIVGHSLGGGIAMQVSYLWPELAGRLVLVASGGLGRSVSPLLRLLSLPGPTRWLMSLVLTQRTSELLDRIREHLPPNPVIDDLAETTSNLADPATRTAFLRVTRSVLGIEGQRVSALDRVHLASVLPTLIVWGERDWIIPVGHGHRAHAMIEHSRLEIFDHSGHFPHIDATGRFVALLEEFIEDTDPSTEGTAQLVQRLREEPPEVPRPA